MYHVVDVVTFFVEYRKGGPTAAVGATRKYDITGVRRK